MRKIVIGYHLTVFSDYLTLMPECGARVNKSGAGTLKPQKIL